MKSVVWVGVALVAVGLALWWAAPNMAAPLIGLVLAGGGVVLVAVGLIMGRRNRTTAP